jgi:hypothetical protein
MSKRASCQECPDKLASGSRRRKKMREPEEGVGIVERVIA